VITGDVAEGIHGGNDDGAERERDHAEIGHGERRLTVHDQGRGYGTDTDEHQERRPDDLGCELLSQPGLVHGNLLDPTPRAVAPREHQYRTSFDNVEYHSEGTLNLRIQQDTFTSCLDSTREKGPIR
jgi:hypothetical protein